MATKKTTSKTAKKTAEAKKTTAKKTATTAKATARKTTAKKTTPKVASAPKTTAKKAATTKTAKKTTAKKSTSGKIAPLKKAKAGTGKTTKSLIAPKATKTTGVGKKAAPKKATAKQKVTAIKPAKKTVTSRKKAAVTQTKGVALEDPSLTTRPVKSQQQPAGAASESIEFLKPSTTDLSSLINIEPYQRKPGEEYMNAQQRKHFEDILYGWKLELMRGVDSTVGHMKDEAANFPDPADRASQEEEFSLELRTRDRERKLIKKIDQALERIQENEFGYCEACGVEIGIRRLEARPTATLCIDCKTLAEIKEKQTAS
jgi:RNA polymerase-binding transcription factor